MKIPHPLHQSLRRLAIETHPLRGRPTRTATILTSHQFPLPPPFLPRTFQPRPHSIIQSQSLLLLSRRKYSTHPSPPEPKIYSFEETQRLSSIVRTPSVNGRRILLIDVREPAELRETGRIPGALSMPLTSNPDAFRLDDEDFRDRFGFERPRGRRVASSSSSFSTILSTGSQDAVGSEREGGKEEGASTESKSPSSADGRKVNRGDGRGNVDEDEGGVEEVVFYCKAGVRSRAAAQLAREWEGIRVGDMRGGWLEWEDKGGSVERD